MTRGNDYRECDDFPGSASEESDAQDFRRRRVMSSIRSVSSPGAALLTALFLVASADAADVGVDTDAKPGAFLGIKVGGQGTRFVIERVLPSSPAEDAGLRVGDIVVTVEGQRFESLQEFANAIVGRKPGDTILIQILRGEEKLKANATLNTRPDKVVLPAEDKEAASVATPENGVDTEKKPSNEKKRPGFLGVRLIEVPKLLSVHLQIAESLGVLVAEVLENSPAALAGIQKDDVLLEIDGKPIVSRRFLQHRLEGESIRLGLLRRGAREITSLYLGARPVGLRGGPGAIAPCDDETSKWLDRLRLPTIRGRLYFERDGKEEVFELPELDLGREGAGFERELVSKLHELGKLPAKIEKRVDTLLKALHEEKERLFDRLESDDCLVNRLQFEKDFCRRFKEQLKRFDLDWECPFDLKQSGRSSYMLRSGDEHHVVTVTRENGVDQITVEDRNGKVLAEKMSREDVETLPADVQKSVRGVLENIDRLFPDIEKARPTLEKSDDERKEAKKRTIKI
jgi:hypothetical protein